MNNRMKKLGASLSKFSFHGGYLALLREKKDDYHYTV